MDTHQTPKGEAVGLMSRIDYMSPGFRQGLIEAAFQVFEDRNVRFVELHGGLVSAPHIKQYLRQFRGKELAERKATLPEEIAQHLKEALPRLHDEGGRIVKIYIVTSPAVNYDGVYGLEIARRLSELRSDIIAWGEESARFPLKYQGKDFWAILPRKAAWASMYFSTRPERLIREKISQSPQDLPMLWVTDCGAVSLVRPAGELARPYISPPALHRLQEVTTSENQVGVSVLEFFPGSDEFLLDTYNFKDIVSNEREAIPNPEGTTQVQLDIVTQLRTGPMTVGMLETATRHSRTQIKEEIAAYNQAQLQPPIMLAEDSKRYDFCTKWIQTKLRYTLPKAEDLHEEKLLAFGCLHAGSIYSQYRFFVEEVPEIILRHGIQFLVGAGDYIEGLKHNLVLRGEVLGAMNYTDQETFAAKLVGAVMVRVFRAYFDKWIKTKKRKRFSQAELTHMVEVALIGFLHWRGNHDEWVEEFGCTPLAVFHTVLPAYITEQLQGILREHNLVVSNLREIVEAKIHYGDEHQLPSGIGMNICHPHMARASTSSLRAQATLQKFPSQIVVSANFHITIATQQWEKALGQRVAFQIGTIVSMTGFEEGKLKRLDTGVGCLGVWSAGERIYRTQIFFVSPAATEPPVVSNEEFLGDILKKLSI